ncbi:MAG: hypothetical protein E7L09_05665 [Enterobacteriaceae bacterium]|nr:hypothetical protein [Enterobacteriaceae bacterium]
MTPENFTYWLKGYMEQIGDAPTKEQWEVIKSQMNGALYPRINVTPHIAPQQWQSPTQHWPMPTIITCGAQ